MHIYQLVIILTTVFSQSTTGQELQDCLVKNGGCEHLCVFLDPNNFSSGFSHCRCAEGFLLDLDGQQCNTDNVCGTADEGEYKCMCRGLEPSLIVSRRRGVHQVDCTRCFSWMTPLRWMVLVGSVTVLATIYPWCKQATERHQTKKTSGASFRSSATNASQIKEDKPNMWDLMLKKKPSTDSDKMSEYSDISSEDSLPPGSFFKDDKFRKPQNKDRDTRKSKSSAAPSKSVYGKNEVGSSSSGASYATSKQEKVSETSGPSQKGKFSRIKRLKSGAAKMLRKL